MDNEGIYDDERQKTNAGRLKFILFWIVGIFVSIFSSYALFESFEQTISRVNVNEMPENPAGFAAGGIIFGGMCLVFHAIMYIIILVDGLSIKPKISITSALLKNDGWIKNVIRVFGYFIIFLFIRDYFNEYLKYREFIMIEMLFYLSSILATLFYIMWVCTFVGKKKIYQERHYEKLGK